MWQELSEFSKRKLKTTSLPIADEPWNLKGRDALLYAIHRTWPLPLRGSVYDPKELELVFGVIDRFYDLAGNDLLKVWGRPNGASNGIKPVLKDHWEDFEIRYPDVIGDDSEPLRSVLKRQHQSTGFYFADLHLNFSEVQHFWPPEERGSE